MGQIKAADTVFDHPLYNTYPVPAGDTPLGGRLMSSSPHTDGLLLVPARAIGTSVSTGSSPALTRNAKGDWSLNLTSGGTPTVYFSGQPQFILRTGESYYRDLTSDPSPAAPAKGIEIVNIFAILNVGVALPTAMTIRLGKTVYPATVASLADTGAAVTVTDLIAATSILPTALTTASDYTNHGASVATPAFSVDDYGLLEFELAATLANTGTIAVAALGAHFNFNYN